MKHIARITAAKTYSQEGVMAVLDQFFSFVLQVIQAKGKGQPTAT